MNIHKELLSSSGSSVGRIQHVGSASAYSDAQTSPIAVDLSSIGIQSGDLIVYLAVGGSSTTDFNPTISGYTKFTTIYSSSSSRNANTATGYKIADGTETSISFSIPNSNAFYSVCSIVKVFRNVDSTTPFDVARTTATGGSSITPNPPLSNTPVTRNCMALAIAGAYQASGLGQTFSSPDLDEFESISANGTAFDSMCGFGVKQLHGFETIDPAVWTASIGANADTNWGAATMILRPA